MMGAAAKSRPNRRGASRRAAFLAAATAVFLERGFENASLRDIIARSGGSRETLYRQFGSKEGLFAAIIGEKCERIMRAVSGPGLEGEPEAVLRALGHAYMEELMTPESLALFRLVIGETSRFPNLGAAVFRSGPEVAAQRLGTYFRRQVKAGALSLEDPELAARQFLEMVKGDLHTRALFEPGRETTAAEIDRCVELAVSTFLSGSCQRSRAASVGPEGLH